MRYYLDQYVRMAAENFEKELARVATFDERAKNIHNNQALRTLLQKIENGEIKPTSNAFEGFHMWFQTDAKYCNAWASDLYYKRGEKRLFNAVADLSNVLGHYKNDIQLADYCKRSGFTFPDGWPNDPVLYDKTVNETAESEQAAKRAAQEIPALQRLRTWLSKKVFPTQD